MRLKPIDVIRALCGQGIVCALGLLIATLVWHSRELHRAALLVFAVAFGAGSIPLVGALVYFGIERLK